MTRICGMVTTMHTIGACVLATSLAVSPASAQSTTREHPEEWRKAVWGFTWRSRPNGIVGLIDMPDIRAAVERALGGR